MTMREDLVRAEGMLYLRAGLDIMRWCEQSLCHCLCLECVSQDGRARWGLAKSSSLN